MVAKSANITVMIRAAEKAAKGLLRDFGELENLQVRKKGPADFVSVADVRTEKLIRDELAHARPDFGFLGEESAESAASNNSGCRWIVDPIDGTTNFLHGIPHFCISIGLEKDGEVIAGVIYDPVKQELFWAEKDAGAYCNDRKLRVSGRENLSEALLATGIPFAGHGDHDGFLGTMKTVMPQIAGVRRLGAAALDLAYVAAGRYEAYWETQIKPWDIAAGIILVREAGGKVTDADGGIAMFQTSSILASSMLMYDRFLALVR
jgi:myo-inositol-1(or 4)-monophosphatase